jgi:hypothetical protein
MLCVLVRISVVLFSKSILRIRPTEILNVVHRQALKKEHNFSETGSLTLGVGWHLINYIFKKKA